MAEDDPPSSATPAREKLLNKQFLRDIVISAVSATLAFLFTLLYFKLTAEAPEVVLMVDRPKQHVLADKVDHVITIGNSGRVSAKRVTLVLRSLRGRLLEKKFAMNPPHLAECSASFSKFGDVVLDCGNLPPKSQISVFLSYKRPPLHEDYVDAWSENAVAKKETLGQAVQMWNSQPWATHSLR
jgi:hypothetical protein